MRSSLHGEQLSVRLGEHHSQESAMTCKCANASRSVVIAIAILLAVASPATSQAVRAANTADKEQITAIVDAWEKAWNSHDMRALARLFHEEGVWILWTGAVWKGRTAIEDGHAAVHKTVFRNSIQRERIEELTFPGPDVAVVRFYSTLTGDERAPDKIIRSRKILIVTKRDGAWKVGWGQNTRLADSTPN
ncbi:MAG TPA: SgcJ/EcaC family oxidoreductase [Vicinamibacterales bacterium]|nr:SgcJ/EcaC family oxidoreductase [Vicinamibacterales bacterium]